MAHSAVQEVSRYPFSVKDDLFLDANIWLFLYGPQQPRPPSYIRTYSNAYRRILSAKSRIHVDVLIVSEFVNRYARLQQNLFAPGSKFKQFRNSPAFKIVAQDIAFNVDRILKHSSRFESGFAALDMSELLNEFAAGASDFNDQVIAELCKSNGLTLVTHDGDFNAPGLSVLTANRNLL
ncbi:MAG: PIN domain-containing protein [Caldilineaceae bacterium]|nr:PIN domain-containing protein [Caldilineaceae bacterium]